MRRLAALFAVLFALAAAPVVTPAAAEPIRLVVLGDSLTAGYGLPPGAGFPARLEAALKKRGRDVTVIDAGVSGDTTAGGLSRLDWSVGTDAQAVIVELGGNDMLRGTDPARTAENLNQIVARLTDRGLPVLVAGMRAPRNLGEAYGEAFDAVFATVAERHGALFYPFFLDGVAADPALNLPDGIHPNEAGVAIIVERILPAVEQLLDRVGAS
ncbi:arylesterase [Pseudoxanthobacter sp. M-2]|uniref:arylesterase n=1 Tax=Pseudoxanthobacter sp. M-2 TaxID=3078754 RepID=UPI0038FCBDCB